MITRQVWKPFVYAYQPLQVILRERWYQGLAGFKKQPQEVFSVHSGIPDFPPITELGIKK